MPAVKVDSVSLGMVGRSGDKSFGLEAYQFEAGGKMHPRVKIAIGVNPVGQSKLRDLCKGTLDKLAGAYDPQSKSMWYEKTFSQTLNDGTKVFRGTRGIADPPSFADMMFTGDQSYSSPASTFAPFLYGDEEDENNRWYTDVRVRDDVTVYLYSKKKGGHEFKKTSEDGEVVYPSGGVPVKNIPMLKRLLSSTLYRDKTWKAKMVLQMTGISMKTGQSGETPQGNPIHSVYPEFHFSVPTAIVLVEEDPTDEDSSCLSEKQREAATRAVLFEGMTAPKNKRRPRDVLIGSQTPTNTPRKKQKKGDASDEGQGTDGEEA